MPMVSDFRPHESYQFFLQEVPELLQVLEEGFLDLHQATDVSHLWDLMRTTHSIKGGAACAGLDAMQAYAHQLESCLKGLAEHPLPVDLRIEELLLQALDFLKAAVIEEVQDRDGNQVLVQAQPLLAELQACFSADDLTHSSETERDIVASLFADDVKRGLKRLTKLLSEEDYSVSIETFKTQLEIFRGIGEITHLPGFIAIATTSLQAINQSPQQLNVIVQQTLADFQSAYTAVMQGDRHLGGEPSSALKKLAISSAKNTSIFLEDVKPSLSEPLTGTRTDNRHQIDSSPLLPSDSLEPSFPEDRTPTPANTFPKGRLIADIFPEKPLAEVNQSFPQPRPQPRPLPPILLSPQSEKQQWELLNTLLGEMVTLDSRLAVQQTQENETLAVGQRSFARLKQLIGQLQSGNNPFSPNQHSHRHISSETSYHRWNQQQHSRFQSSLQEVTEEISQLGEFFQDFSLIFQQYQTLLKQRQKQLQQVQDYLLQAQMVPISNLLNQFPRMVRQLAQERKKSVRLVLVGNATLVDKTVIEKLYDPLLHILRNAIDHGVESPDVRQALQKPLPATITIRAKHQGHHTYVEIEDDGQGINLDAIREKVVAQGWMTSEDVDKLPIHHLYDYLFQPNFSTAKTISHLSGRGVGLYAVRTQIRACQGSIRLHSERGQRTMFSLRLPLTTTVTKLLLFRSQQQLYALPVDALTALTYATPTLLKSNKEQIYLRWKQQDIPLYTLSQLFTYRYPLPSISRETFGLTTLESVTGNFPVLLLARDSQIVAFQVDEILSKKELVIKPLGNQLISAPDYIQGAVVLGNGQLFPVLEGAALVEWCLQTRNPGLPRLRSSFSLANRPVIPTVMIVDDSLTIRSVLSLSLRKEGYQVLQAKDGWDAMTLLAQSPGVAAIICDIEMPHMNGLEFLSRCRRQGFSLPVIVLTYRNSQRYRLLAKQLGASAYMTKPYLDKELLQVLNNCLNEPGELSNEG